MNSVLKDGTKVIGSNEKPSGLVKPNWDAWTDYALLVKTALEGCPNSNSQPLYHITRPEEPWTKDVENLAKDSIIIKREYTMVTTKRPKSKGAGIKTTPVFEIENGFGKVPHKMCRNPKNPHQVVLLPGYVWRVKEVIPKGTNGSKRVFIKVEMIKAFSRNDDGSFKLTDKGLELNAAATPPGPGPDSVDKDGSQNQPVTDKKATGKIGSIVGDKIEGDNTMLYSGLLGTVALIGAWFFCCRAAPVKRGLLPLWN